MALALASSVGSNVSGCRLNRTAASNDSAMISSSIRLPGSPLSTRSTKFVNHAQIRPCTARCSAHTTAAVAVGPSELDLVNQYSEIVPDSVAGDDFERFRPTAATVNASLILGISSLPEAKFDSAVDSALAYNKCTIQQGANRLSCFLDKALVNIGAELTKEVSGKVSTEVDPRLANDTQAIVDKVHRLSEMYAEVGVPRYRLLFKIPATWEGIEAARRLEDHGILSHVTGVNSFAQAAACAHAHVAVIQISVGRVRDWARVNLGDKEVDAAVRRGEDAGIQLVRRAYQFIAKHGHRTKVMASNIRTKNDALSLLGVDYIIAPSKLLNQLSSTPASAESEEAFHLAVTPPRSTDGIVFSREEMRPWDKARFEAAVGPCARQLLAAEIESAVGQTNRVEEHFAKVWPPPNV